MNNKKEASNTSAKLKNGPGGIACTCCNKFNCHPRNMKHLARRILRRVNKLHLRDEISEV